jgi:tRNA A-37 threonylcarbamoyl transferase component Bud32
MLLNSLYLAIEILMFILAAPLLDESKFAEGSAFDLGALFGRRPEKAKMDFSKAPDLQRTPVKKLQDTGDEAEFQETEHIDPPPPASMEKPEAAPETKAMDSTPPPVPAPDKQSTPPAPVAIPEWQTGQPISEHLKMEQKPQPEESVKDSPTDTGGEPERPQSDLSASPLSGTGGDKKVTHLGRYEVKSVIGKGAMGTVFKGIDPAINRPVALKTIRLDFVSDQSEMEELRERLMREARAAGKLSHPNIVTIYDIGSQDNLHYIAMEYLEGKTLEDMIKRKVQFSYKIIASIITQICTALQYAHEQGIVHRDIKPANIMVLPDYTVKVMDFGIARVDSSSMTRTGIAMGTPNYIAPELLQGKSVDRRCDIFSVGVVIYEMLTGRRPFKGENLTSLIYSIINDKPPSPSSINENIPLLFDHIVDRALKKDPVERYQKASDLKSALSDFIGSFGGPSKVNI